MAARRKRKARAKKARRKSGRTVAPKPARGRARGRRVTRKPKSRRTPRSTKPLRAVKRPHTFAAAEAQSPVEALRNTADDLSAAARSAEARAETHPPEEDELRQAAIDLSTHARAIREKALEDFARSLGASLKTVTDATAHAKEKLARLDEIAKALAILTKLIGLGAAIASGNVQGAISAAASLGAELGAKDKNSARDKAGDLKLSSNKERNMAENPTHYCMCVTVGELSAADQAAMKNYRAAVLKNARWQPGQNIKIRFLGGDPALRKRVRDVALEWTKIANLNFQFVDAAPTDIRIAFVPGNGSWSTLGSMCRNVQEPGPTMNYGWLTPQSTDTELRRVVLHEFGHAIGLIHEHQNPKGGIKWNKTAVIHDLSGPPNNWDEAKIEINMFHHYPPGDVVATNVDAKSIMIYPIPKSWTVGGFSAELNTELSDNDKKLIKSVYLR